MCFYLKGQDLNNSIILSRKTLGIIFRWFNNFLSFKTLLGPFSPGLKSLASFFGFGPDGQFSMASYWLCSVICAVKRRKKVYRKTSGVQCIVQLSQPSAKRSILKRSRNYIFLIKRTLVENIFEALTDSSDDTKRGLTKNLAALSQSMLKC